MQYRSHPRIDFQPSALGFGCMRLPILDDQPDKIDDEKAIPMVRWAIDHGVNYLDTAWPYHRGTSEGFVARVLKDGYRDKVKIADKYPCWENIESLADADKIFEEQLRRLETDHIDFYLLHAINKSTWAKIKEFDLIGWAQRLKDEGRISWLGFSFHDELSLFKEIVDAHPWDFCQIQYNYMDIGYQAGREGMRYASQKGIAVIVMEPLRGGDIVRSIPPDVAELYASAPVQRTPAEWALRWLWDQPDVWLVLSGMNTIADAIENVAVASESTPGCMSDEEYKLLEQVWKAYMDRNPVGCTGCRYCMPCPQGVNIPMLLAMLNEWRMFENEGKTGFFLTYIPEAARPDKCTSCGECLSKCPQHLAIPDLLREAQALYEQLVYKSQ